MRCLQTLGCRRIPAAQPSQRRATLAAAPLRRRQPPWLPPSLSRPRRQQRARHLGVCASAELVQQTLLGHSPWGVWAALTAAGAAGLWCERTKWGKEMSGALLSTLFGLALSNLGVIPSEAPAYGIVNQYFLPLAVPLLLLSADLRRVLRDTGRLLPAFAWGALGTVVGSFTAFKLMPLRMLGDDGWKVAAALTARHIGGSVNYVAVSETLQLSPNARMAGLAADDLIVSLYFLTLYALVRHVSPDPAAAAPQAAAGPVLAAATAAAPVASDLSPPAAAAAVEQEQQRGVTTLHGATALALSCAICFAGTQAAAALHHRGGSITLITAITVSLATAAPRLLAPLAASGEGLAAMLMQLFFASVGASGNLRVVVRTAPTLFAWSLVAISLHLLICLAGERLWGFTRRDMALASNANIGGPTTAAGMAAAKGWRGSLVPALLVGILGYATATFVGLVCGQAFRRMQFA